MLPKVTAPTIFHYGDSLRYDDNFYKDYYPIPIEGAKRLFKEGKYKLKCLSDGIEFIFDPADDSNFVIPEELFNSESKWFVLRYTD